ncbi:MAG: FAD-binding oxidoreductase [Chloroflexi bacterium]|jgi:decaprenylphospho-beta-D-ribofuranose 2-oxidase|nr:FAD-binding oxidoreductase [Chloroflexota bacterium]MBT3671194.1 FAD-binding oxidoreductase [Chloroflexota bacterium]MBT4002524.1 FAD-binding oxidoreductase [Chloroflexota bacterium]MBT4304347.1 FAD-binding oxidoreductase [Chloroflexota bacterium]MBT4534366.1 FAD-binding oxidoreductase [Chloroflexota bacterium]
MAKKGKLFNIDPVKQLQKLENFGHSIHGPGYVYQPTHVDELHDLVLGAKKGSFTIALRGAGRSYGDAAMNNAQIVIDLSRMNRVLAWNKDTGVIKVEPGVTIERLWRYTLGDGWWSPVMPGTMFPTLGGCLGANIHGKNNWKAGTIGEHVLEFTAMMANGKEITCTPKKNKDLFYSMIGGMGILGIFTSITYQMKKVYSGNLDVKAWAVPNLKDLLSATDEGKENDYIVAWLDATQKGKGLGRGQMHSANYMSAEKGVHDSQSLRLDHQDLSPNIMGVVPRSIVPLFLGLGMNNLGAWAGNTAKYLLNRTIGNNKQYFQSFVEFTFLLDYVPGWERAYGKDGLIQYQSFIPKENAYQTFKEILKTSHRYRNPSYLGVVKRHRPDKFLLSHAVDGFSLALDLKVKDRNRKKLRELTGELNQIVLDGEGKFYFAKDSTLTIDVVKSYLGEKAVKKFKSLKNKVDPDGLFQSDLYRRCFGE